ncbi:hypothetical protein [Phytohabitans rumicis]|uniref:Uncharacterized protein n=1 Tax=Phytohabitans rumicis TaxID=1076125 RepID=A0A6V8L0A6_9ACTN|nr:hypothetical protein [Phytohabitans rumicis]GFJ89020.1 hypothetical protein Prum_026620 [Phytohabitans rumicis]
MRRTAVISSTVLCAALLGVATNVGSAQLPTDWAPYLWLAWPTAAVLAAVLIIAELRREHPEAAAGGPAAFYRRTLLQRVELYWVRNVLDRSVYHEARIELGLTAQVTGDHPWDIVVRGADGAARPVPAGTPIGSVFGDLNQSLLVLGHPGRARPRRCWSCSGRSSRRRGRTATSRSRSCSTSRPGRSSGSHWVTG